MTIGREVVGNAIQMVVCHLGPDQQVFCEASKFLWKTVNVSMETRLGKGAPRSQSSAGPRAGAAGPFKAALSTATEAGKHHLAGEGLAFQWYHTAGESWLVAFA